jgi:hypothetical protein
LRVNGIWGFIGRKHAMQRRNRFAWLGFGALAATTAACQVISGLSGYHESGSASGTGGTGAGGATSASVAVSSSAESSSAESSSAESSSAASSSSSTCGGPLQDAGAVNAYRFVFVTSMAHVGKFPPPTGISADGLLGADEFCRCLADAPGSFLPLKGRHWHAWLSLSGDPTSASAKSRLRFADGGLEFEYRLADQLHTVFPVGYRFDVDGGPADLMHAINVNEIGDVEQPTFAWTGTLPDGTAAAPYLCGNWNLPLTGLDAGNGHVGESEATTDQWTESSNGGAPYCTTEQHLYCFEADP